MAEQIAEYLIIEPEFKLLISIPARVHKLWTGAAWAEGPVYFRDGDFLLFSDIPNNRMIRFVPDHTGLAGTGSVYRQPANNTNGHTRDLEGRLVSCEHGARRVSRTGYDGRVETLVDSFNGKKLNSPNDVVVKSDGTVWFTDPAYGILSDLEGWRGEKEYGGCYVFRFDPNSGKLDVDGGQLRDAERHRVQPRREEALHRRHRPDPRPRRAAPHPRLRRGRGRQALGRRGLRRVRRRLLRRLPPRHRGPGLDQRRRRRPLLRPGRPPARQDPGTRDRANVCFGGYKRNRLYICGTTSLYAVYTHVNGCQVP